MCAPKPATHRLYPLGLLIALLPLFTIHLCLLLSFSENKLEWCNPYWLDCHSISATGRHGLAYFVFKGGMLTAMVLLALFWWINQWWLNNQTTKASVLIGWLGSLASLALVIYTLSLGHDGNIPYLLRRIGVISYLGLTFICQLLLSASLQRKAATQVQGRHLLMLSTLILVLALISLALDAALGAQYKRLENAIEWGLILLINLHALFIVGVWRKVDLRVTLRHQ